MAMRGLKLKALTPSWLKHQRRLPENPVLTQRKPVSCEVTLTEDIAGQLYVSFNTTAQKPGDGLLDLRICEDTLLVFELQNNGPEIWEFSHPAGITLAYDVPAAPDQDWLQNYSMVPPDTGDDELCLTAQIEARHSFRKQLRNYKYNLKFKIYTSPRGTTYIEPIELFIDPDIKNPGDYGLFPKGPKLLSAKRKAAAKKRR